MDEMEERQGLILTRIGAVEDILRLYALKHQTQHPSPVPSSAPVLPSPFPSSAPVLPSPVPSLAPVFSSPVPSSAPVFSSPVPSSAPVLPSPVPSLAPVFSSPVPSVFPATPTLPVQKKSLRTSTPLRLESAEIKREELAPIDGITQKYFKLLGKDSKIGELACRLATECFFGDSIMVRCTVHGFRDKPALPLKELIELKKVLFKHFPKYWSTPQNLCG